MSDTASQTKDRLAASLSGDYVIERELGQGGMATVYLAHDVRHARKVALKVLRPDLAAVIGGARFLQEIRTVANLQHPHILPLFDSGSVDGTVFYVMPFVEGESLRDRLTRERQLPIDDAIRITREVASALDYAHKRGVLHRDIKPENILLHEGQALVADFGIALAVARTDTAPRLTETGMSLGTPHYMSPEQAMGERTLDARTDIYSLGCVTYEMLAGEPPFTGPSAQAIIARVVTEEPRSLQAQRRTIAPHVDAAVACALEKLAADRFATAGEFANALVNLGVVTLPTTGRRLTLPGPGRATGAASRFRALLPWGVATAALLIAAASMWLRKVPDAPVVRQRIALWQSQVEPGSLGRSLAIAPDGSALVYVDTVGGVRQLWLKEADVAFASPVLGTRGAAGPIFSPDGQWIAFAAEDRLKKVPLSGGAAVTLADSVNTRFPTIAWLDNGTILFSDLRFNLAAVSEEGGEKRSIVAANPRTRGVANVTALPGSRGALITTCSFGCPDVELSVVDLTTGETRVLATEFLKGWYVPGGRLVLVRRDGAVFYAPLDLRKLEMRGQPVPVMEGVRTSVGEADIVVSDNGTMIYIAGPASTGGMLYDLSWVTATGEVTPVDPAWSFTPAGNGGIAVSPDGRRVAVATRSGGAEDIWVKDLATGAVMRLTFGGINIRPEWSADGRTIYYISTPTDGDAVVRARRADGTGTDEVVLDLERPVFEIARTIEPSVFLVRLGAPPSRDIGLWRRGVAGADSVRPLMASPTYDEIAPAPSPDGRWLAYVSNESGRNEVYVRPLSDVDAGRWQVSREGGVEPTWSHSGGELFFRDAAAALVAVRVAPGNAFSIGEPRVLFSAAAFRQGQSRQETFHVAPDGRFVFARELRPAGADEQAPLIRVDNWFATLHEPERRR